MRTFWFLLALVLSLGLLSQSYFTVDPTEFVYVTQFGAPVAVFDGGATDSDAGLHWRWPWPIQSIQRLDRRLQYFDLPAAELLTKDAAGEIDKTLTVKAFVCWRIVGKDIHPDGVDLFIRRLGTAKQAEATLGKRLNGELGAVIGQMAAWMISSARMLMPLCRPPLAGPAPLACWAVPYRKARCWPSPVSRRIQPFASMLRKVDVKLEEFAPPPAQ